MVGLSVSIRASHSITMVEGLDLGFCTRSVQEWMLAGQVQLTLPSV
jgi:hypothetical protein